MTEKSQNGQSNYVDATNYPHVEELMILSDVLITDISSLTYDFATLGRPVIHYFPDIDEYRADRGLYSGSDDELRYRVDQNELIQEIVDVLSLRGTRVKVPPENACSERKFHLGCLTNTRSADSVTNASTENETLFPFSWVKNYKFDFRRQECSQAEN